MNWADYQQQIPDEWALKERYDFGCDVCGHEMLFQPNLMMREFRVNRGTGRCSACQSFLHLHIASSNDMGVSILWSRFALMEKEARAHGANN